MSKHLPHSYWLRGQRVTISVILKSGKHLSRTTKPLHGVTLETVADEVCRGFDFTDTTEDAWMSPKGDVFLEIKEQA